jgi:phosphoglycerate dehydrogenase-like enzyme
VGVLDGKLFASMREGAVFINTGRGRQVNEAELIEVLKKRPDLTALLDVTYPEPPENGSELYTLPNVFLSPHIAGSLNDEVHRMADYMIAEYKRFANGEATQYEVRESMLITSGQ